MTKRGEHIYYILNKEHVISKASVETRARTEEPSIIRLKGALFHFIEFIFCTKGQFTGNGN